VPATQRTVQQLGDGLVGRPDNTEGQYERLTGRWLNASVINNHTMMQWLAGNAGPLNPNVPPTQQAFRIEPAYPHGPSYKYEQNVFATPLHLQRNLYPGLCEKRCSADETCKAYQETRWQAAGVAPECYLFHMFSFRSSYSAKPLHFKDTYWWEKEGDAAYDQSHKADFYLAITKPKAKPWLHIPKTPAQFPAESATSTKRDPVPPVRRRLQGVY